MVKGPLIPLQISMERLHTSADISSYAQQFHHTCNSNSLPCSRHRLVQFLGASVACGRCSGSVLLVLLQFGLALVQDRFQALPLPSLSYLGAHIQSGFAHIGGGASLGCGCCGSFLLPLQSAFRLGYVLTKALQDSKQRSLLDGTVFPNRW